MVAPVLKNENRDIFSSSQDIYLASARLRIAHSRVFFDYCYSQGKNFTEPPWRSIDIRAHNRISRTVLAHKQLRVPSSRHGQTRRCALRAKSVACLYSTFNFPLCALNKQHSLNDSERAGDLHRRSRSQHDIPRRTQALTPAHASARPR